MTNRLTSLTETIKHTLTTQPATAAADYCALFNLIRAGAITTDEAAEIMTDVHVKRAVGKIEAGQYIKVDAL